MTDGESAAEVFETAWVLGADFSSRSLLPAYLECFLIARSFHFLQQGQLIRRAFCGSMLQTKSTIRPQMQNLLLSILLAFAVNAYLSVSKDELTNRPEPFEILSVIAFAPNRY